uniref:7TM_GPCR_Srx domain-containing protein n=1 Tax=Meloidogyne hapla TaxID=6305 RepID=A0A1I8BG67_MELHA
MFQLQSIFGTTAAQTAMFSTAVDRLLSVLFPIKYNNFKIFPYLFVHTFLAVSSGVWMSINAILFSNKYPTLPVTGHLSNLYVLDMEIIHEYIIVLCIFITVIYLIVWIIIRYKYSATNIQSDTQSRLLKSLILIVSIVIGGYIIGSVLHLIIINIFNFNDIQVN